MHTATEPQLGFDSLGLEPAILDAITKAGFTIPTPIQERAIPPALLGADIMGIAQTGTGKTMAFALPILNSLITREGRGLIIVPTRELALQVEESIRAVTRLLNPSLRTICLIGGMPMYPQIRDLKSRPRLIIATPGRLRDHLERRTIDFSDVRFLVLDEADRMLDMGFAPQIQDVCSQLPLERQTMLFSATMAAEVARLAGTYMKNPIRIEIASEGTTAANIQELLTSYIVGYYFWTINA